MVVEPASSSAVAELVALINRAYAAGEEGLWVGEVGRTDEDEIAQAVAAGHMLVARLAGGRIVGCARTRPIDEHRSEVGLIAVDPSSWRSGAGGALITEAESRARARGATTMQLELLVPRTGTHASKERLRAWYGRRGYTITRRIPFEDYVPRAAPHLRAPGDILIFEKPL